VVGDSLLGAAICTVLSVLVGFGPGVALLAALTAMIMLPLLRVFSSARSRFIQTNREKRYGWSGALFATGRLTVRQRLSDAPASNWHADQLQPLGQC
jgi:hypothetical protein